MSIALAIKLHFMPNQKLAMEFLKAEQAYKTEETIIIKKEIFKRIEEGTY